jgi:ubiquinone biosynthesis protein Coq4
MKVTMDRDFATYLLRAFDDPQEYGVHQLFNAWWRYAPESVKAKYVADFEAIPTQRAFVEEHYYGEPLQLEALADYPAGSFGRAFREFIVDNGLEKNIAINYRMFHQALEGDGRLDGMPAPIKYAVLRGFQAHDFQHVVTGYDSSPRGEIALQAFCLAQLRFPYFAMWMSVVTTRMTFLDPDAIVPAMDAITAGWQLGRRVANIQFEKWETMLDQPVADLRRRYDIDPAGRLPLAA